MAVPLWAVIVTLVLDKILLRLALVNVLALFDYIIPVL
jgi:hypothetical protein